MLYGGVCGSWAFSKYHIGSHKKGGLKAPSECTYRHVLAERSSLQLAVLLTVKKSSALRFCLTIQDNFCVKLDISMPTKLLLNCTINNK